MGRIAAVADVFDALTSVRSYKKAWTVEDAMNLIKKESGKHFDPRLADAFINILPSAIQIKDEYSD